MLALDLTKPDECEKVELTLRFGCLMYYVMQRLAQSSEDEEGKVGGGAKMLFLLIAYLKRILSVRNLCVYAAHRTLAGGARVRPLEQHVAEHQLCATHQLFLKHGDAAASVELMHTAIAALRASGDAAARLARALEESYAANQYYSAALKSTRLPDEDFEQRSFERSRCRNTALTALDSLGL